MSNSKKLVNATDAAYIAGLFDGEGSVDFARRKEKRGNVQSILMRIEMTDENVLNWVHETLGVGTVRKRNRSPSRKAHWKDAWVYSVRFRDALHVCKILWPHAIVKLHKIEQIIDHYEPDIQGLDDNIVDLALERELRE
jgi:hypothetical protein|tara:strand:+ start:1918 stop:2334 length:417 start_codon:yes stop_codon:yes gene_type:complete